MNRRDKLILTGVAALLVGLGAAATLLSDQAQERETAVARPSRPAAEYEDQKRLGSKTLQRLSRIPSNEVPQEFKEAENYLLDRWGHMEDAGLAAPGIMPEGDMYFQDRRIIQGVRGNGKPIYAKSYIRPELFRGPTMKRNSPMMAALERNPHASIPGRTEAQVRANALALAKRTGVLADVTKNKGGKLKTMQELPGSSFRERGQGSGVTITDQ